jgi:hypothetical protein
MAQDHNTQDNPSLALAKASSRNELTPSEPEAIDAGALLALGANAWATCVGWTLLPPDVSMREAALASAPLALLFAAVGLHARVSSARMHAVVRWLLLCGYPASLAAGMCLGSEAARERVHTPLTMLLACLSLLGYAAAAVHACRAQLPWLPAVRTTPQAARGAVLAPRITLRRVVIAIMLFGALCIASVAPLLPTYNALETAWGSVSDAGAVLAAVVGVAIAVSVVGVHFGALLHTRRDQPVLSARQRNNRLALALFLALLGAVVYFSVVV